ATATADQEQQPPAAVVVVLVYLEVLGEIVDPPRQQCDLDFRRAGVTLTGRVPGDDLLLDRCVQRHVRSLIFDPDFGAPRRDPAPRGRRRFRGTGYPRAGRLRVQPTRPTMSATMEGTMRPAY